MAEQLSFSVVICTYNRCENLKKCLASVERQNFDNYEIIIIDDHSSDETNQFLRNYEFFSKSLRIHRNNENKGISYSRNKAAHMAYKDIIAFIDDDCIADKKWLAELAIPFKDPKVAIVGGLIKDPVPINISMMAARGHYKRFNKEGTCDSLPGGAANLAIRKSFYMANPVENMALEDWELCQKAIDHGQLIYNCPKAVVVHEHFHNLKTLLRQRYRYGVGQTWFRQRYKPFPLNGKTMTVVVSFLLLPLLFIWRFLFLPVAIILSMILLIVLYKDLRKGEKSLQQAFLSFPVFILISLSECYGRIVGLLKKQKQINFGKDKLKITK